jgi:hypothetical protein
MVVPTTITEVPNDTYVPFESKLCPLIAVPSGEILYASRIPEKRDLVAHVRDNDNISVLLPWVGRWRTDVFLINEPGRVVRVLR